MKVEHDYLRRLEPENYRGTACVLWSMTIENRRTGWLEPAFHAFFREILLHTLARYGLACPAYCLMPDHMHLLWLGLGKRSDQLLASQFFRTHTNLLLRGHSTNRFELQKQAHDHLLRHEERQKDALSETLFYIMENPVRAGLVSKASEWPYSGGMIVGYPSLDSHQSDYWECFWKIYARLVEIA